MDHITYILLNVYSFIQGGILAHTRHINVSHFMRTTSATGIHPCFIRKGG